VLGVEFVVHVFFFFLQISIVGEEKPNLYKSCRDLEGD